MMRLRAGRGYRLGLWATVLGSALVLWACVEKPLPTVSTVGSARFTIRAIFEAQQLSAAQSVDVFAGYRLASGANVTLSTAHEALSGGTMQSSLSIDLAPCLADENRVGPSDACPLVIGVTARDGVGVAIDSMRAGPFSVTPGQASAPLSVQLSLADTVTLAVGDTVRIPAPTGGGASSSFTSSDATVATVSGVGLVTTHSVGLVTITATNGQTTAATRVNIIGELAWVVSPPASVLAGQPMSVSVELVGAGGAVVTSASTAVSLVLAPASAGATLGGTTQLAASSGVANFSNLSITKAGSAFTLIASARAGSSVASSPFSVVAAAPNAPASTLSLSPGSIAAGQSGTLSVFARDQYGNAVAGAQVAVSANSTDLTCTPASGVTAVDGSFNSAINVSLLAASATRTITATLAGGAAILNTSVIVTAAPKVAGLHVIAVPATDTAGAPFSVSVELVDATGTRITSATNSISLALGTSPFGAILGGTTTRTAVAGVAVFPNLAITKAGPGFTLTASSTGLPSASSASFAILAAAPSVSQSTAVLTPNPFMAGTSATLSVLVRDQYSNPDSGTKVVLTSIPADPTFSPANGTTAADGTFNSTVSIPISAPVGARTITVALGNGAIQVPVIVTVSPFIGLRWVQQPGNEFDDALFNTLQVEIIDATLTRITSATNTITLTVSQNSFGAFLQNCGSGGAPLVSAPAVSGLFSFVGACVQETGTALTMIASSPGTVPATSAAFNVLNSLINQALSTIQVSPTTVAAGNSVSVSLIARDNSNQLDPGTPVTLSIDNSAGVTFSPISGTTDPVHATFSSTVTFAAAAIGARTLTITTNGFVLHYAITVTP
jgi:hypothetical protein